MDRELILTALGVGAVLGTSALIEKAQNGKERLLANSATNYPHTLTIETGDTGGGFIIDVTERMVPAGNNEGIHDQAFPSKGVEGYLDSCNTASYHFAGDVCTVGLDDDVTIYVDGQEVRYHE